VNADASPRKAHPARAERVPRAGWDRARAGRPRRVRRIPPGVSLLGGDGEAAERRRVLRHPYRDAEGRPVARAPVEVETVRSSPDHDHRPEVRARNPRLKHAVGSRDRPALVCSEGGADEPSRGVLPEAVTDPSSRDPGPEVAQAGPRVDRGPVTGPGETSDKRAQSRHVEAHGEGDFLSRNGRERVRDRAPDPGGSSDPPRRRGPRAAPERERHRPGKERAHR
jgi:hypothetical protein